MNSIRQLATVSIIGSFAAGCGQNASHQTATGTVEFALQAAMGDRTFQLRDGTFAITGPTDTTLTTETNADALILQQELPVGSYDVELQSGWQLHEIVDDVGQAVDATLMTENPISFEIEEGATTAVLYRFAVDDGELTFATGDLQLTLEVVPAQTGTVIFSELMSNPAELPDAEGEWLELQNVSDTPVDLQGCTISRGTTTLTITETLELAPQAFATLANSETPGFTPSQASPSLSLPNSGSYALALECSGLVVDSVTIDASLWPGGAGVATSLSPDSASAAANDDPSAWCAASTAYNADLGSPGSANPACS